MNTTSPASSLEDVKKIVIEFFILKGMDLIGAMVMLVIGFLLARWVGQTLQKWLDKRDLEPPARALMVKIVRLMVMAFVVVIVLQKLGVPIAPMIAGIGVAGVGIGLAMQGLLSNIVAGLMIIFTKPYRVGEYIEVVGVSGLVNSIELMTTELIHADRSRVVIPNRKIVGEILHNYGSLRQLNLSVGVGYESDPGQVIAVVDEILRSNPKILQDPAPVVGISTLADSSVAVAIKPWVAAGDYDAASAEINRAVLETFRIKGISIPFPQREVRLLGRLP